MRRRALVLALSGAMIPARVLRAQQKATPVVGLLLSGLTPWDFSPGPHPLSDSSVKKGLQGNRLRRWTKRGVRIPMGRGSFGSAAGTGRRPRQPQCGCDHNNQRHPGGTRGEERHLDDPDRLRQCRRPGRSGPGRQSRPAGRQPDGLRRQHHRFGIQAARSAYRAGSAGQCDCIAGEPEQCNYRVHISKHAGGGPREGGKAHCSERPAPKTRSNPPSLLSSNCKSARSSSRAILSSPMGAS